jgi:hypothetical protein
MNDAAQLKKCISLLQGQSRGRARQQLLQAIREQVRSNSSSTDSIARHCIYTTRSKAAGVGLRTGQDGTAARSETHMQGNTWCLCRA